MRPLVLALLLIIGIVRADFDSDYAECRDDEHFGTEKLVCDPDHHLAPKTVNKLTALLTDLQTRITCTCEGGCRRADGRDGYIGLIQITDSKKFTDLATSTRQAYENAHLGNATCKHGLYIVYIHDTKKLATYRGGDSFVILSDEDMKKLHELAKKGSTGEGDEQALAYLLANYNEDVAKASVAQRAESWTPVIGLVIAILIILLIIALLLLLFLCRWCCGDRSRTKEIYHVNDETLQNYKTIEPIYIATPPHRSPDGIYSTPYSGSPLPFPPPPGTSGPVTPTSTYRTRITPLHGPLPPAHLAGSPYGPPGLFGPPGPLGPPGPRGPPSLRGGPGGPILLPPPGAFPPPGAYSQPPSHVDTPASRRRGRPERRPTLPISSGDREPVRRTASDISRPIPVAAAFAPSLRPPPGPPGPFGPPVPFGGPPFGGPAGPISPSSFSPRSPDANSLQPSVISEQDLFFLDPKRKLETQTKEDFIS